MISSKTANVIVLSILISVFFTMAWFRLIDGDEGFYILASKLVLEGKMLYKDFFYPQMPLLPYVYGLWFKLFGVSWLSARTLSAIFSVLLGFLLYRHVLKLFQNQLLAILAVILYSFTGLVFGWYPVAKTFALSILLLFGSYLLIQSNIKHNFLLSGILLGLAIDTRLFFVAVIPALLFDVYQKDRKILPILTFIIGCTIAVIPNLFFIIKDLDVYMFNNLGYHALRNEFGFVGDLKQKVKMADELLGNFQFLLLLLSNIYYVIVCYLNKIRPNSAIYIIAILIIVNLLPTPTYVQYYSAIIPFMIICTMHLFHITLVGEKLSIQAKRFLVFALLAYIIASPMAFFKFMVWGKGVPGIENGGNAINWKISTVNEIASVVDHYTQPGDPVITWWPGYLVESSAIALPTMENHFGIEVGHKAPSNKLYRYRITTVDEVKGKIQNRKAKIIILGNWVQKEQYKSIIETSGYRLTKTAGHSEVYYLKE